MSKTNTFENDLLLLIFNNTNIGDLGDTTGVQGSGTPGSLYAGLHTGTLDDTCTQTTNETTYTGYDRLAIARASGSGGFTVAGNSVSNFDDETFGECTALPGADLTYFTFGDTASGAGTALYYGTLTPDIVMAVGVKPQLKNTTAITED